MSGRKPLRTDYVYTAMTVDPAPAIKTFRTLASAKRAVGTRVRKTAPDIWVGAPSAVITRTSLVN